MQPSRGEFVQRALLVVGLVVLVGVLLWLVWASADVLLLIFGGILLGVFLRGLSDLLRMFLPVPPFWSVVIVLCLLAGLLAGGGWLLGSAVATQLSELGEALTKSWSQLEAHLRQYSWGERLLSGINWQTLTRGESLSRVTSLFSSTIGAAFSAVVILFTGIYLAFDPQLYRRGLVSLVPLSARGRSGEVLDAMGQTLRGWLISQSFSMVVVGSATTLGLWLLGTPMPIALGMIAFVFTFVPYVGPIAAAVPALLVGFTVSPTHALYVGLLYFAVQMVEGNLLTPLVQQQMVKMPPAVTIVAQVLMGVLLGAVGVVFATPLAACALVLTKMLYVEDLLGDVSHPQSESQAECA
jgi:predicted PurR-regulated permease PerM